MTSLPCVRLETYAIVRARTARRVTGASRAHGSKRRGDESAARTLWLPGIAR
jgi:hypothetical protein